VRGDGHDVVSNARDLGEESADVPVVKRENQTISFSHVCDQQPKNNKTKNKKQKTKNKKQKTKNKKQKTKNKKQKTKNKKQKKRKIHKLPTSVKREPSTAVNPNQRTEL
jgi:hypothetical protein